LGVWFGMQVTNLDFHNYDREIKRMLDRLNGIIPVYQKVSKKLNRAKDYSAISPKNKELLFRVYHDCVLKGNSKARILAKVGQKEVICLQCTFI